MTDDPHARIEARVSWPAIGLMVTAVLGVLTGLASIGMNMMMAGVYLQGHTTADHLNVMMSLLSGLFGVVGIGAAVFVGYAAMKMQDLQYYGLCVAAAIIAVFPCFSPCCCTGIPFGAWALIVLMDAEVKSAFQRN